MRIFRIAAAAAFIISCGGCARSDVTSTVPVQPLTPSVANIQAGTSGYKELVRFAGGNGGQSPHAGLTPLGGLLYGTTELGGLASGTCTAGCGTIFSIDPASGAETVVYRFTGGVNGEFPAANLTVANGELYGTTARGGDVTCYSGGGCGTLFVFDPVSGNETTLYGFSGGQDGQAPFAGVTYLGEKLYGTTASGGSTCGGNGCGTIYSFDLTTGSESVLYAFQSGQDGADPEAGLVLFHGTLYGTTAAGGNASCQQGSCGTIFKFDVSSGREHVVYRFTGGQDGSSPLTMTNANGSLFGVALTGGQTSCSVFYNQCGTVFSFKPSSGAESTLYDFQGGSDGANPIAITAAHHMLFGTTEFGGTGCGTVHCGTVFALDPTTGTEQILYRFQGLPKRDGKFPEALTAVAGKLYGTTIAGGNGTCKSQGGCGIVFGLND